jgi:hypothetical protein
MAVAATAAPLAQVPPPAAADVFAVRGVEVDRSASSAAQAREQAIVEGQRLAWRRLTAAKRSLDHVRREMEAVR